MKNLALAMLMAASASPALAVDITGTLNFVAPGGNNYFDPAENQVPAGYGNAAGTTVSVGSGVEFGYEDAFNLLTADFSNGSLTIREITSNGAYNFFTSFQSSTPGFFNNATFNSNGFGGSFTVISDVLTFTSPTTILSGTADRTAVITFDGPGRGGSTAPVPEPGTWALMLVGFGGVGYAMRRRQRVAVSFS